MAKLSLIFSDIELGKKDVCDDFVEEALLAEVILNNLVEAKDHKVDFIFNGDIFDFLKVSYKKRFPLVITEEISLHKLEKVAHAHPLFFKTLKTVLSKPDTRVIFITGNHDFDTAFPKVQKRIRELIDKKKSKRIIFPGLDFQDHLLYVEHGSQLDPLFIVDPKTLIKGGRLRLPFGAKVVLDYLIEFKLALPLLERLHPKKLTLSFLPKPYRRQFVVDGFLYLLKSFFYLQWFDEDYKISMRHFLSYLKSLIFQRYDLIIYKAARKKLLNSRFKVLSIGHSHQPGIYSINNKVLINTGAWRDDYEFSNKYLAYYPTNKTYGYVLHTRTKIISAKLVEVSSRRPPMNMKRIVNFMGRKTKDLAKVFS